MGKSVTIEYWATELEVAAGRIDKWKVLYQDNLMNGLVNEVMMITPVVKGWMQKGYRWTAPDGDTRRYGNIVYYSHWAEHGHRLFNTNKIFPGLWVLYRTTMNMFIPIAVKSAQEAWAKVKNV